MVAEFEVDLSFSIDKRKQIYDDIRDILKTTEPETASEVSCGLNLKVTKR